MNCLLDDERRAYRQQAEEAQLKYEQLDSKWEQEYAELRERSTSSVMHSRKEAQERVDFVEKEYKDENTKIKKESDEARDNLIRKGRTMIQEAKQRAKEELMAVVDECHDFKEKFNVVTNEKNDMEQVLRPKISMLKQKLEFSVNQVNTLTRDTDELEESIKTLEREKFKLQEDNDRYRRQLGGRYGADGKAQAQLEKLQKEYNAMLEENRNVKKQARYGGTNVLGAISESNSSEDGSQGYSRGGGVNRSTLSQMRLEYEEQIEGLNDEKRELIMKNSSASTDVQKAEQRAWEREQEVAKLKSEITSLKLARQRAEFSHDRSMDLGPDALLENRSPRELSFFSAHDEERSPGFASKSPGTPTRSPGFDRSRIAGSSGSPGIERAMKIKAEREKALRNRLSSYTSSPSRPVHSPGLAALDASASKLELSLTDQVLAPTTKHQQEANQGQSSPRVTFATGGNGLKQSPFKNSSPQPKTLMDYTKIDESKVSADSRPECQQS
jgi:chromosome segregation ATPase